MKQRVVPEFVGLQEAPDYRLGPVFGSVRAEGHDNERGGVGQHTSPGMVVSLCPFK